MQFQQFETTVSTILSRFWSQFSLEKGVNLEFNSLPRFQVNPHYGKSALPTPHLILLISYAILVNAQ